MIIVVNIHIPYSETDQAGINSKNIELRYNYDWSHINTYTYMYVYVCMYMCVFIGTQTVYTKHMQKLITS